MSGRTETLSQPADAPRPQPDAAVEAWRAMQGLVASQRPRFLALAGELGLAPGQLMALRRLEPRAPIPMRELADRLGCDNSNVTGIVDRLEQSGLVERRTAPRDRRVKMLRVTDHGRSVRERVITHLDAPPAAISSLGEDDRRALRDILRRALG